TLRALLVNGSKHSSSTIRKYTSDVVTPYRVPIRNPNNLGREAMKPAMGGGLSPLSSASSEFMMPHRITRAPRYRKGSGGSDGNRRVQSGSVDHSSWTPNTWDARHWPAI